jgi:alpha-beta hydrolase superfamily lysophospholipase
MLGWTVLTMAVVFYGGGGWYFSDQLRTDLLVPKPHQPEYRATVAGIGTDTVVLTQGNPADGELFNTGYYGLTWEGGYGQVDEIVGQTENQVTRRFALLGGDAPSVGTSVDVDPWVYPEDYRSAVDLDLEDVEYQSPLGPMDAVFVPGSSDTWVVAVHGRNATPRETLRLAKPLSELGYPILAITHRNDRDQPGDPSGFLQFGVTEWEDLEGAVEYAVTHGADRVVLVGLSTGAAAAMSFLEQSELADRVSGVVFDAPNIDIGATVTYNAIQRKLPLIGLPVPSSLGWAAKTISSVRFGVDWGAIDYVSRADELDAPLLVFHGIEDPSVPIETSRELAAKRPDLVTLVEFEGAKHVQSWNADPNRYEEAVVAFVNGL